MNTPNEKQARTVIFGQLVEGNLEDEKPRVGYVDRTTGKTVQRVLLKDMIAHHEELEDGNSVFLLKSVSVKGTHIDVSSVYDCAIGNATQQAIADLWNEGNDVADVYALPSNDNADDDIALDFDDEVAVDDDEDIALDFDDDFDDSVPIASSTDIELSTTSAVSSVVPNDGDETAGMDKYQKAAKKAADLRQQLYQQAEAKAKELGLKTDLARGMLAGKREHDFGPWNFHALALPVDVRYPDEKGQEMLEMQLAQTVAEYVDEGQVEELVAELTAIMPECSTHIPMKDNQGNDRVRVLTNPTLAGKPVNKSPNSPLHPEYGAVLNRAMGPNFTHIDHADLFPPIIDAVADIDGITWDAVSYDKGAKASLTIDLTDMATQYRKEAASELTGYLNLAANVRESFLAEENGGHRCGVTILNQNDGKGALAGYLSVMRTYCKNLAMRGSNELMFKVRHVNGSVAAFDVNEIASKLRAAFLESQKHLLKMSILRHLPVEINTFDKILTAFNKQGLVAQPTATLDVANYDKVYDKEGNKLKDFDPIAAKNIMKLTHGHAWQAMNKGWIDPDLHFVKCEEDSVNTLFHSAQVGSGYFTHKPIFVDDKLQTKSGTTEKMDNFMNKSGAMTEFWETVAETAVDTYLNETGATEITDMVDFKQFFADNPSLVKLPMQSGKGKSATISMVSVDEIPAFQDTWDIKVISPKA